MRSLAVGVAALALAGSAAAALPRSGVFLPGRSLGGVYLGESASAVRAALGAHGVCIGCATPTWYFNYKPFDQRGLAVELTGRRVTAVYTLWQPTGWHAAKGLRLGVVDAQLTTSVGPARLGRVPELRRTRCRRPPRSLGLLRRAGKALGLWTAARTRRTRAGDRARRRAGGRAAFARHRTPHPGIDVAHARRLGRGIGLREGGVLPARRSVQVPRRVQQDRVADRGRARARRRRVLVGQSRAGRRARCAPARHPRDDRDAGRRAGSEARGDARLRGRDRGYDRFADNREEIGARLAQERGPALVKPYDDPLVMAGQGTVALELLARCPTSTCS